MITVALTDIDYELARQMQKTILEREKDSPSAMVVQKQCNLVGFLGEIAVKKYFDRIKKKYVDSGIQRKGGDPYDLLVDGVKIDVKTTKKFDQIVMNEWQRTKAIRGKVVLVGVKLYEEDLKAVMFGYAYPEDLQRDEEKDFTFKEQVKKMYSVPNWKLKQFQVDNIVVI